MSSGFGLCPRFLQRPPGFSSVLQLLKCPLSRPKSSLLGVLSSGFDCRVSSRCAGPGPSGSDLACRPAWTVLHSRCPPGPPPLPVPDGPSVLQVFVSSLVSSGTFSGPPVASRCPTPDKGPNFSATGVLQVSSQLLFGVLRCACPPTFSCPSGLRTKGLSVGRSVLLRVSSWPLFVSSGVLQDSGVSSGVRRRTRAPDGVLRVSSWPLIVSSGVLQDSGVSSGSSGCPPGVPDPDRPLLLPLSSRVLHRSRAWTVLQVLSAPCLRTPSSVASSGFPGPGLSSIPGVLPSPYVTCSGKRDQMAQNYSSSTLES